jgi:serine/threonine-protein kinase RsbW
MLEADPKPGRIDLSPPSTLEGVEAVEIAAARLAADAGLNENERFQVTLAVREAALNAVLHGNRSDPAKRIHASLEVTGEALVVTISDQGCGFDPQTLPDALAAENLLRRSGRGIFLIQSLMDAVHFRQLHPGTELTMVKHRAAAVGKNSPHGGQGETLVTLAIASRELDGVVVLDLVGRIGLGEGSLQLRDAIRDLIGQGKLCILLNLQAVHAIDSSGLGELVSALTILRSRGGELKLLHPAGKVLSLLQLTRLDTVFDIQDDEAKAIASFR